MPVLPPVPGWAPGIRALAAAVETSGHRLAAACRDLVRFRDGAVWDGPAGEAFGARIAQVPTVLDRAARRHLGAAAPLRAYADVLEVEQARAQRCVEEHRDAWEAYVALEDRAAALVASGLDESAPDLLVVRARQQEEAATVGRAEREHRAALDRLDAADTRCAAALRALADDPIADPVVYRGLRTLSSVGHGVGVLGSAPATVFPALAAAGTVGEGVGTTADAGLLALYGEGDAAALATTAATAALGAGGQALRAGAKAGVVQRADGAVVGVTRLSTSERVVAGSVHTARDRIAQARARFEVPGDRGTASALLGGPAPRPPRTMTSVSLRQRVVDGARTRVRTRYDTALTELAVVSAGGRSTQRMYAAGVTLSVAEKALPRVVEQQRRPGPTP